jgi:hypothetical protein
VLLSHILLFRLIISTSVEESYEWSRSYLSQVESEHSLSALPPPASSPPQATQSEGHSIDDGSSYDTTRISSDTSIQRLPTFRIPMHQLSTLKSLVHGSAGNGKASLLVGLLDVDGPDKVRIRKGPDAGKEISLLKLVLGSPDSTVCKLTVWRELADAWGGSLRRGDVVLLQGQVLLARNPTSLISIQISCSLGNQMDHAYALHRGI